MITRKRLLVAVATEIAEYTGCDNEAALEAAAASLAAIGQHVILPMLDAYEFDARPMFRERITNDVRDILIEDETQAGRDEKEEIDVRDE